MNAWFAAWGMKLLALGAVIGALWLAVHTYNTKITAKAVLKESARVEGIYAPKFKALTKKFNDLTTNVIQSRLEAESAIKLKQQEFKLEALNKTNRYEAEVKSLKLAAVQTAAGHAADTRLADERLRDATRPLATGDGSGQQGIRLGQYTNGLASLYSQCEKDLGLIIGTATETLDRLAESEAAVRALK